MFFKAAFLIALTPALLSIALASGDIEHTYGRQDSYNLSLYYDDNGNPIYHRGDGTYEYHNDMTAHDQGQLLPGQRPPPATDFTFNVGIVLPIALIIFLANRCIPGVLLCGIGLAIWSRIGNSGGIDRLSSNQYDRRTIGQSSRGADEQYNHFDGYNPPTAFDNRYNDFAYNQDDRTSFQCGWPEHDCAKTPGISESPEPILTSGGYRDSVNAVKRIRMHSDLPWVFLSHVEPNTLKNIETCGFLLGKLSPTDDYVVTELYIPPQAGTANECNVRSNGDETVREYVISNDLLILGWIHTHPSQACFLSSIDLHTQFGHQTTQSSFVGIVVAPSDPNNKIGFFSLTGKGLSILRSCSERGFHQHSDNQGLYSVSNHVVLKDNMMFTIVDARQSATGVDKSTAFTAPVNYVDEESNAVSQTQKLTTVFVPAAVRHGFAQRAKNNDNTIGYLLSNGKTDVHGRCTVTEMYIPPQSETFEMEIENVFNHAKQNGLVLHGWILLAEDLSWSEIDLHRQYEFQKSHELFFGIVVHPRKWTSYDVFMLTGHGLNSCEVCRQPLCGLHRHIDRRQVCSKARHCHFKDGPLVVIDDRLELTKPHKNSLYKSKSDSQVFDSIRGFAGKLTGHHRGSVSRRFNGLWKKK